MNPQRCSQCGSEQVARLKWVDVNDNTIYNNLLVDMKPTFCLECQDECDIIDESEYIDEILDDLDKI